MTENRKINRVGLIGMGLVSSILAATIVLSPRPGHILEARAQLRNGLLAEQIVDEHQELYRKGVSDFLQMGETRQVEVKSRFPTDEASWVNRQRKALVIDIAGRLEGIPAFDRTRYAPYRETRAIEKWTLIPKVESIREEDPREKGYPSVMALECMASERGIISVRPWFKGYYSSDANHQNYVPFDEDIPKDTEYTGMIMPPFIWLDASTHKVMSPLLQLCVRSR